MQLAALESHGALLNPPVHLQLERARIARRPAAQLLHVGSGHCAARRRPLCPLAAVLHAKEVEAQPVRLAHVDPVVVQVVGARLERPARAQDDAGGAGTHRRQRGLRSGEATADDEHPRAPHADNAVRHRAAPAEQLGSVRHPSRRLLSEESAHEREERGGHNRRPGRPRREDDCLGDNAVLDALALVAHHVLAAVAVLGHPRRIPTVPLVG
mmetsp:Transcript_10644/g.33863  ORF Transcript_10644/g.33863 Transcript_10644/m.33863 type:complete len:212 (-) Transcript_10644:559-1194(-)